jgi:CubicO group peptidase (beta-lactamase class C family)
MRLPLLFTLLLLSISSPSFAAAPRDLADVLGPMAQQYKLPGFVAAIVHGDQVVALGSVGVRKFGDPTPFLPADDIHLGSDTKAMTAMLIAQLVDKKLLSFDAPMSEVFPDLAAKMNPDMANVTVRQLLRHDGGLPHDLDWWSINNTGLPLRDQRMMAVEQALSAAPATPIGQFSYSNVSYTLLGAIVESKLHMTWEDAIQQNLFTPLHMTTAGFGPPGTKDKVDQPWGHVIQDGQLQAVQFDNAPVMAPAGEVHCSIGDWAKFISETLRAYRGQPTLVSAATYKDMMTPAPGQSYAGGWAFVGGGLVLNHAGSNTMWYCEAWVAPRPNFAVLVATNDGSDPAAAACGDAMLRLLAINATMARDDKVTR